MAKKEKDKRVLSMQDLRGAMAEEHPERDAGMSAFMAMTSDTVEEQQPEGTYRFALNGVMEDRETTGRLQNEESNEECIDITDNVPTEYSIILDTCCGNMVYLSSSDIDKIRSFVYEELGRCEGYEYEGLSIDGNAFSTISDAVVYIETCGFGTYRISQTGCSTVKRTLSVTDCCGNVHSYEYEDGAVVDTLSAMNMFPCEDLYVVHEYSISKGNVTIEQHIPAMQSRTIVMDDDVSIVYSCMQEGTECDFFEKYSDQIRYYDDGNPNYVGEQLFDGIYYMTYRSCEDLYVWFRIRYELRGYVGSAVSHVEVSGETIGTNIYPIDMLSNDENDGDAVFVVDGNNAYIVVHLNGIHPYEIFNIKIGNLGHRDPADDCYVEFYVKHVTLINVGKNAITPAKTIIDVKDSYLGLADKSGKETKGIVGNYDGENIVEGFVVSDGFGNKYVSKTDEMEINIYHNRKIELIYGKE